MIGLESNVQVNEVWLILTEFWMYIVAAQNAAARTKSSKWQILTLSQLSAAPCSALFIGAGLFIVAALNP